MYIPFYGVLATLSTFLPVLVGAVRWKADARKEVGLFYFLLLFNAISAGLQLVLASFNINNLWISHVSALAEVELVLFAFRSWQQNETARTIILSAAVFYLITWVFLRFIEEFTGPSLIAFPVARAVVMVFSFQMLYVLARDSEAPLLNMPRFWIVATTMISGAAAIMFFALQGMITRMQVSEVVRVFYAYWTLTILLNCSYSWAFLCKASQTNSGGH
ncbi:MAG: hypothetical protein MUE68_09430 [Bacteroidetes bacterium]|jgi:hypothetical protein|nr:hypothetical protein [Bacteroidota bacterium]